MSERTRAFITAQARTCSELVGALRERVGAHGRITDFHVLCWGRPTTTLSVLIDFDGDVPAAARAIGADVVGGKLLCMNLPKPGDFACDAPPVGAVCLGVCK